MILLNKETLNYSICSQHTEKKSLTARLLISENLPYFLGHFPNNPVLPAVAIIDISHYFIAQYFCNNPYTEISHLKVKSKISPQTRILIQIDQKIRNSFEVVWKIEDLQTESVAVEINMTY